MQQIPIEVPWMISPSEDIVSYEGKPGFVRATLCCQGSRRVHQAFVAQWEAARQRPMPDRLYNESAVFLVEICFEQAAFFCRNALPYRLPEDPPELLSPEAFHRRWDETGICPSPGFYRVPDSPLAALLHAGNSLTHWRIQGQGEELHVLARRWYAARLPGPGGFSAEGPEKGPWQG